MRLNFTLPALKESFQVLMRRPAYSLMVLLTLGLSSGVLVTAFALAQALLWRPLPWPDASRLVSLSYALGDEGFRPISGLSEPLLRALREAMPDVRTSRIDKQHHTVKWPGEAVGENVWEVDADFFALLGARWAQGRVVAGSAPEAPGLVLSHQTWQQRFAGRADVLGHHLQVGKRHLPIVAVLDAAFVSPVQPGESVTLFVLDGPDAQAQRDAPFTGNLAALAHLTPSGNKATLAATMQAIWARQAAADPARGFHFSLRAQAEALPLRALVVGDSGQPVRLVLAGLSVLLAVSLLGLSSLVWAQVAARASELALREALGLSPWGLRSLLLREHLLLLSAVLLLALWVARWGIELIPLLSGNKLPLLSTVQLDAACFGFALILMGLLLGWLMLLSELALAGGSLSGRLRSGSKGGLQSPLRRPMRQLLSAGQLFLVAVLVFGSAAVIGRALEELHQDRGIALQGVALAQIGFAEEWPEDPAARAALLDQRRSLWKTLIPQIKTLLRAQPGVQAVAVAHGAPFSRLLMRSEFQDAQGRRLGAESIEVDADYFQVAGLRFLAGRGWPASGDPAPLWVVNERLAAGLGGAQAALGQTLHAGGESGRIVGVVANVWREDAAPQVFMPLRRYAAGDQELLIRFQGGLPEAAITQAQLRRLHPALRLGTFSELSEQMRRHLHSLILAAWVAAAVAALGIVLALCGVFASSLQQARLRRSEFGIRLAHGAWPQRLLREQMWAAAWPIAAGLSLGGLAVRHAAPLLNTHGVALPQLSLPAALSAGGLLLLLSLASVGFAARREIVRSPWQSLRND